MISDFWIVLQWWGSLFLVGAVAWPLTKKLFAGWYDEGYLFSKAVGMATVTWIVYVLGTLRVMPFSVMSIGVAMGTVFLIGLVFNFQFSIFNFHFKFQISNFKLGMNARRSVRQAFVIGLEEIFFLAALFVWSWVKGHEPSIRGLEKFMDYGFMQSILNSTYFPPADMWYAGAPVNYYYFGHLVTATLTKLSGLDLAYTFNLMLATLFALTLTMSFSIGKQIGGGIVTAFLVTLAGNMQTIYAFFKGFAAYWYADATRFIPFTIHEFPGYSFVVSDVHGHVLSLPFVLLAVAMLIRFSLYTFRFTLVFYGFLVGILLMTNAPDGPIYFALALLVLVIIQLSNNPIIKLSNIRKIGIDIAIIAGVAILTSLPFLVHFKSFVTGIAVNCPPAFLANTKIGPLIFEGVEKCQISPLWMWWLLWGFFVYCGGWLIVKLVKFGKLAQFDKMIVLFFVFALALVVFPEFFYFKDIYPAHFRSNTMFKLGYQAFILFSIVAGYTIVASLRRTVHSAQCTVLRTLFFVFLAPQLFLVSIFPIFAVRSYFGGLKNYEGIYGLTWLSREYPDDWRAIEWMKGQHQRETLVEADGDSYTDYGRFSSFTGIPTVIGWPVHEWLWRGSYDVVAPRREEVRLVYESADVQATRAILRKYAVRYIIVGKLEREKYKSLNEGMFGLLGKELFRSGKTVIYETY